MKKIDHLTIRGIITCQSDLRIGGSDDLLQIGGADLTFIKHPVTRKPYIPGSSLKGKMRSEMERREGRFSGRYNDEPYDGKNGDSFVCRIFGSHKNTNYDKGAPRILVRDCLLITGGESQRAGNTAISRQTGAALNGSLRTMESVAEGAVFSLEIGLQIFEIDANCEYAGAKGAKALLAYTLLALRYVEETGLGSGTSRGFGKVKITGPDGGNFKVKPEGPAEPPPYDMEP